MKELKRGPGPLRCGRRLCVTGCLCLIALTACSLPFGPKIHISGPPERSYPQGQVLSSPRQDSGVIALARRQIGVPYRWGGEAPKDGFDCSGLIFWVYGQNGIRVPRLAREQAVCGGAVRANTLLPGDIVVFRVGRTYHTGLYSGRGNFIHSPKRGQLVREESLDAGYWRRYYIGARRVL